jgi:tetratricopeptide (TPR) repeat protein
MAPEDPAFRSAEIDLWHELGFARIWMHDFGSEPVAEAWRTALTLAMQFGSPFQRGRALLTAATLARNQGQWRMGRNYEEQAFPFAESSGDLFLRGSLLGAYGGTLYHFGELERALDYLNQNIALSDAPVQPSFIWMRSSLSDITHVRKAKCLWLMGFPDRAQTIVHQFLKNAHARIALFERFSLFDFTAMLYSFIRNVAHVQRLGDELIQLSSKYEFPFYLRAGKMYRGWALAQSGDPRAGTVLVQESVNGHRESGPRAFEPYWRALLVETLMLAGELGEANDEVGTALAFADETGNTYWSAHLLKLKGDCVFALSGSAVKAEAWYLRSLELAKVQGAKSLELRAAMALARLWQKQDKCVEAHALLSDIYNWFTEGFDTPDLSEAKAWLAETA